MGVEKPTQRSGVEVENAPAEVVSEWLHRGELTDLMNGRDPGKLKPAADPPAEPKGDADQGARGGKPMGQLDANAIRGMSAAQIVEARKAGRLDQLLGIKG